MDATLQQLSPSEDQLDLERVVDVDTNVGPLWVERDAKIMTPTLVESGGWQPDVIKLMSRFVRPGMTVVDAGANIGYVSVFASKLVGPTGRVVCVEADPANVSILRANLWRNGCTNAQVLPIAAWSERAELNLNVNPDGGGACTQVGPGASQGSTIAAYRLDEVIDGTVDYLKIDCEGSDHLVLRGATGMFRAKPRMIATVEFVPGHDMHTGDTPQDILGTYRELGLKPYMIDAAGRLRPTTFAELADSGSDEELVVLDFALSPRRPTRLVFGHYLTSGPERGFERLLRLGGDLLEYVPARIRPPIRRRDRQR
jgi:FkbM family methyltransferase